MKAAAVGLFPLVLIACSMLRAASCSSTPGNETDRLTLLEFKKGISFDPQQALASWNDTTHFCNWKGVQCRMNRVTSLDLNTLRLVGNIILSLGNLTFLENLDLSDNRLTGQMPSSLGQLPGLQTLYLSNNTLHGAIPTFANCSNLKALLLNGNNLVGKFPDLPLGLEVIELSSNHLSGTIPSFVANITTLRHLGCFLNNFHGTIQDEFAKLLKLEALYVSDNLLAGKFPHAILNLSTLVELSLAKNHFSGELPPDLGSYFPSLQYLTIAQNSFHGHIPSSLANASELAQIDMSTNNFTGVVPKSIGKLRKLWLLNLEYNKLEARSKKDWEFIDSLGNCSKLQKLSVACNHLEGHIPVSLGNLSVELQSLYLGYNQLSGGFPSGIANFQNLNSLTIYNNQFTGKIPEWLGNLKSLKVLGLSDNIFTGNIPSALSNLSQLFYLNMGSNQLEGHLPANIGNLQNLQAFNVSDNLLHGYISNGIFRIPTIMLIDLSTNKLDGQLPYDVGNAKQLRELYLSSNMLSGYIPNTLGHCESLENIDFDQNRLEGSIPITLGNIRGLQGVNLSHNYLTGSIPMSLGDLQFLEQLDLSFNNLKGQVPKKGIFNNVTAMRIDGNPSLCGGVVELHLMACSSVMPLDRSFQSIVKKLVIPLASMVSLSILISIVLLLKRKQRTKYVTMPSFGKKYPRMSYSDLARATESFSTSNLIGKGRFSSVYKGTLFQERTMVAIKVFSLETKGARKSFIAECNAIRNVRHRNLVPVLTACSSIDSNGNDFNALVYAFMPGGDLHVLLYSIQDNGDTSTLSRITLAQRLCILANVADALEHLHHNNQGTIVHCDIKPSNILLDESMTAYVGDFGLARFTVDSAASSSTNDSVSASSIAIKGTIGYVAPECAIGGDVSCAGDVYSFGIVLLEIILRKRPTDDMFADGLNIVKFVEMNFPDKISQIVDPELQEYQHDNHLSQELSSTLRQRTFACLLSVLDIGLQCTKASPYDRMDMREVAARLQKVKEAYLREN